MNTRVRFNVPSKSTGSPIKEVYPNGEFGWTFPLPNEGDLLEWIDEKGRDHSNKVFKRLFQVREGVCQVTIQMN